ncbi:hypothetical protein H5410_064813 [Solanum commersonii]|uniref:Leucine-rich repeat-containing N-terminal plant-type domain-containing protein n=1 Tax=Solanum commersonii TaxID=4109 RepID=A0A9J5VYG6_SOLCO|nr:hypothetical protein H5410_064813 [Solanum commersonii]
MLKFTNRYQKITNKGCGEVVSTPSSLTKRSQVRFPLGTESPLLGSALPPNAGLPSVNPDLVGLQFSSISILPHKHQTISLLKFKNTLTIDPSAAHYYCPKPYPKTSSWNTSRDCCSWDGVVCDDITGHVIELDLSCSNLTGTIDSNSSLFQLSHLQRLDLSSNNFSNSHISPEFGKFSNLKHLHLSDSNFSGQIPSEISHLSKLHSLRLSSIYYSYNLRLTTHDFKSLLQNLTQLRELHLSRINISSTIPLNFSSHLTTLILSETGLYGIIPESIFHLPNLETLDLGINHELNGYFPKTKWNSSASLLELDLSLVNFSCNLPESLGYHLTSLRSLDLAYCNLRGPIPESLSNLTRLKYLVLSYNSLNGTIPPGMLSLPSLKIIDLSFNHLSGPLEDFKSNSLIWIILEGNQLQGHLPHSIQNLVNLTYLFLSFNNFSGRVDASLFSNLKLLLYLGLSYNNISLTNDNNVTLPESLNTLKLAACEVKELEFLRSAKLLWQLDLSNNKIQGRIPDWAWSNWMSSSYTLNMSHNMLSSVDSIPLQSLDTIDLRSNLLQDTNDTISGQLDDEESNSKFQSDFWKGALMGYGSGLCIGLSIIYFMLSTGKPIWLARIILEMEHKIMRERRKKQRRQRNYRRRNNHF